MGNRNIPTIQELLNNKSLSETLMADEKFVSEAKEILTKEDKEIDNTQLKELLDKLEKNIADKIELNELELSEVSGVVGGSTKKKPCENLSKPAKSAIKGVIHMFFDVNFAALGAITGYVAGYVVGDQATAGISSLLNEKFHADIESNTTVKATRGVGVTAGIAGMFGGGYGGYKLSELICNKLGV